MGRSTHADAQVLNVSRHANSDNSEDLDQIVVVQQHDSSRTVVLHGDVNEHTISNVIMHLLQLASINHKPIHLMVSTYGGSVDEMFSLYDTIKFLPCPVHTVALGKVMSAGVLLLASGTKGKRMIGQSARIMIHPISGVVHGNVFEVINGSNEYQRLQELMVNALEKETKMNSKQINDIMKSGNDFYITPSQAIKFGIVDKIIGENIQQKVVKTI
jgi:ATP-dependent Clp protease protease subunit